MWPTTCFWRERLSSFEFFSFITLKGRLPVKWTAYEALLYGVYTTQSDVWVGNIIRHLRSPCSFFVKYKCSHLPFLLIFSWSYGILLNEILTVGKRGLKHKHTQYCKKKKHSLINWVLHQLLRATVRKYRPSSGKSWKIDCLHFLSIDSF